MKYKKTLYGILLVSLALNLFFAGVFTTFVLRPGPLRPANPQDMFNMEAARAAIDPAYHPVVDKIWSELREGQRPKFRNIFRLRRQTQQLLLADEFDEVAFEELTMKMQESSDETRIVLARVMMDLASGLPDAERQKYFKAGFDRRNMERQRRRPPPEEDG